MIVKAFLLDIGYWLHN